MNVLRKILYFCIVCSFVFFLVSCSGETVEGPDKAHVDIGQEKTTIQPHNEQEEMVEDDVSSSWELLTVAIDSESYGNVAYIGMPEVLEIDGQYIMYYGVSQPGKGTAIDYALSDDGLSWEIAGTVLEGADDEDDPYYFINGADIVETDDGYVMYYTAAPQMSQDSIPLWRVYRASSQDGFDWESEGVVINIEEYEEDSQFKLAGHGTYFIAEDGTYVAMFSGEFTDHPEKGRPSDIKFATSSDGLEWSAFETLYESWHDPIVVEKDGQYLMFASYEDANFGVAVSEDGITWPESPDFIELTVNGNAVTEREDGTGDLGALVMDDEVYIFSNYGYPSTEIGIFVQE